MPKASSLSRREFESDNEEDMAEKFNNDDTGSLSGARSPHERLDSPQSSTSFFGNLTPEVVRSRDGSTFSNFAVEAPAHPYFGPATPGNRTDIQLIVQHGIVLQSDGEVGKALPTEPMTAISTSHKRARSLSPRRAYNVPCLPTSLKIASQGPIMVQLNPPSAGEIPSSDLPGALSSLQPGQSLSATALEMTLSALPQDNVLILDPQWYDCDANKLPSHVPRIWDSITSILLPLHHRTAQHWTLAIFDMVDHTIQHYDSLSTPEPTSVDQHLLNLADRFKTGNWTIWDIIGAQQRNGHDCGVFVLISAIFALAKTTRPSQFDCTLWRFLFQAMLSGMVAGEECVGFEKVASGFDGDLGRSSSSKSILVNT